MNDETFRFRVDRIVPESPRVKTFRLRPEGPSLPFRFRPGQHMGVRPARAGGPAPEPVEWRHFSLSSSPLEDFLEVTVLKQGSLSDRMHSLAPGDRVETTRPVGGFVLREPVGHGPVFFAAGIGMAPIRGMIRFCLGKGLGNAISLFASFPNPEQAIYREEIEAWAERGPSLSVWLTYTGTEGKAVSHGKGTHPWNREFLEARIDRPMERAYYLCAPAGLMDKVETHLAAMGVPEDQVHRERWQ
jgi:ferredoxin-NADP reductase